MWQDLQLRKAGEALCRPGGSLASQKQQPQKPCQLSQIGSIWLVPKERWVSETFRFLSHHLPFFFSVLVSLTKTAKKGLELKQNLIEEVRACFFVIIIFSQPSYLVLKVGVGLSVRDSSKHPRLSEALEQPLPLWGQSITARPLLPRDSRAP